MRTFLAVARCGSFAEAAEQVSLTQAAVSIQMKSLAQELGRELFERSGRAVVLNAAGHAVLPEVQRIVELYDRLRKPAHEPGRLAGAVSVGAVVSCMGALSKVVSRLKTEHPGLAIKVFSGKSSELADKVEAGDLDAALVAEPGKRRAPLRWTELYQEPMAVVAHARARGHHARDVLARHPFLRFDRRERTGILIERTLRRLQWPVNDYLELNSIDTLVELVRQEVGVTVLPVLRGATWQRDRALRIVALPAAAQGATRAIGMIERPEHAGHAITEAILAQCRVLFESPAETRPRAGGRRGA